MYDREQNLDLELQRVYIPSTIVFRPDGTGTRIYKVIGELHYKLYKLMRGLFHKKYKHPFDIGLRLSAKSELKQQITRTKEIHINPLEMYTNLIGVPIHTVDNIIDKVISKQEQVIISFGEYTTDFNISQPTNHWRNMLLLTIPISLLGLDNIPPLSLTDNHAVIRTMSEEGYLAYTLWMYPSILMYRQNLSNILNKYIVYKEKSRKEVPYEDSEFIIDIVKRILLDTEYTSTYSLNKIFW